MLSKKYKNMNDLIKKYVKLGVNQNKIVVSKSIWSLSEKCLVNEKFYGGENRKFGYDENNRFVSLQIYDGLTENIVDEINSSEGIIITDATYGIENHYRFGFIPIS